MGVRLEIEKVRKSALKREKWKFEIIWRSLPYLLITISIGLPRKYGDLWFSSSVQNRKTKHKRAFRSRYSRL